MLVNVKNVNMRAIGIFVGAIATLIAATTDPVRAQANKSTLTVALTSDVPSLDGSQDSSPIGYNVRLNLYDALTELTADGALAPRLATSWESSPDATTWLRYRQNSV